MSGGVSGVSSFSTSPRQPARMPITSCPRSNDRRATARMTAFSPGQSPPPVRMPTFIGLSLCAAREKIRLPSDARPIRRCRSPAPARRSRGRRARARDRRGDRGVEALARASRRGADGGRTPAPARGRSAPRGAADGALGGAARGASRLEPRPRARHAGRTAGRAGIPRCGWGTPGARSRCSWRRSRTGARRPRGACAGASSTRSTPRRSWRRRRRVCAACGSSRRRSPSAAISFSSTGISSTATLWITWAGWWTDPVDGRVRTVDGNSGGDGLVARRDRENGSVRAFVRDS